MTTETTDAALCERLGALASDPTVMKENGEEDFFIFNAAVVMGEAKDRIEALGKEVKQLQHEAWTAYRRGYVDGLAAGGSDAPR